MNWIVNDGVSDELETSKVHLAVENKWKWVR